MISYEPTNFNRQPLAVVLGWLFNIAVLLLLLAIVFGCAGAVTPMQQMYEQDAKLTGILRVVAQYTNLPACTVQPAAACKDMKVASDLAKASVEANKLVNQGWADAKRGVNPKVGQITSAISVITTIILTEKIEDLSKKGEDT